MPGRRQRACRYWTFASRILAKLAMAPGGSNRTLDALNAAGIEMVTLPYDKMQLNGGGIHCSTSPLVRDPL